MLHEMAHAMVATRAADVVFWPLGMEKGRRNTRSSHSRRGSISEGAASRRGSVSEGATPFSSPFLRRGSNAMATTNASPPSRRGSIIAEAMPTANRSADKAASPAPSPSSLRAGAVAHKARQDSVPSEAGAVGSAWRASVSETEGDVAAATCLASPPPKRPTPSPVTTRRVLTKASSQHNILALVRRWPQPEEKAVEVCRRMMLLRQAVTGEDEAEARTRLNTEKAREGFASLCASDTITYSALDAALKAKDGEAWLNLMFRHAVAGRALAGPGEQSDANLTMSLLEDDEQVFCLLRFLDTDGDGRVSQDDFCVALRQPERWPKPPSPPLVPSPPS